MKRIICALVALACLTLASQAQAPSSDRVPMASVLAAASPLGDIVIGSPEAKVTVVEYTSPLCPYCGRFRREAWPRIKAEFVDTGRVRWVVREFAISNADFAAYVLVRCGKPDEAASSIDMLFGRQRDLARGDRSSEGFVEVAGLMGWDRDAIAGCMRDQRLVSAVDVSRRRAETELGVTGTPTFFAGGRRLLGLMGYDDLEGILETSGKPAGP